MAHKRGRRWVASGYSKQKGQKVYLGSFDSKKEASLCEADWKLRSRKPGSETCASFVERWIRDYPRPRESTNRHNAERLARFAEEFARVKLSDVSRPQARAWALKHKSHMPAVRAMFSDALRDGLIQENPFTNLRLPGSRGRKDIVALTELELMSLADCALDLRMELGDFAVEYRAMVVFSGYVGVRPGELFALRAELVSGSSARIERSYDSKTHRTGPTKNGKARTVVVPPPAQAALRDVRPHASGLLFSTPRDRQWTQSAHHRYWSRLRLIADRPGLDHYELRHCAATILLERGATPWDVSIQLGHTDGGRLVTQLYGHPSHDGARQRLLDMWRAA